VNEIKDCDHIDIDCEFHYIDFSGQVVIEGPFVDAAQFHEGYALVQVCEGNKNYDFNIKGCNRGLVDKHEQVTIRPEIDYVFAHNYVSEGLLGIHFSTENESNFSSGFIDVEGNIIIPPSYCETGNFNEGLAWVSKCEECNNHDGCSYGFVDKTGHLAIPIEYSLKEVFTEGPAPFTKNVFRYGFMNRSGEIVIKPDYMDAWNFSEGLAAVKVVEKRESKSLFGRKKIHYCTRIGFIDHSGNYVIEPQPFREVGSFHEGLAVVKVCRDQCCE